MPSLTLLLQNKILISAGLAWMISQISKAILYAFLNRHFEITRLTGDGGMPSSHSATVTAGAVACAMTCGLDSPVFALSVLFAAITCHDAMNSRREIGKQAVILNELIKSLEREDPFEVVLKEFVGHTPLQVLVGIILGAVTAVLVCI